ncbi:MAG: ArsR/SmtB family transcription factor [Desulfonatronovibrionaceae bacterium]
MHKKALIFKALSEEPRLRILSLLTSGELCVCEIEAALGLPQSTVSRHLALLRQAELVQGRRKGVWMYYRLLDDPDGMHKQILEVVRIYLTQDPAAQKDLSRLKDYFARAKNSPCCPHREKSLD